MTDVNPYPAAAEAVDNQLSQWIEGIRRSVETGFDRMDRRIDTMVTKDAFNSEISRLDQRDDGIESRMENGFGDIKRDMEFGFKAIESRDAHRDQVARQRDEARDAKFGRRMGWTISITALGFTAFQIVFTLLTA